MGSSLLTRALVAMAAALLAVGPLEAAGETLTWRSREFIPTNRYYLGAAPRPRTVTSTPSAAPSASRGHSSARSRKAFSRSPCRRAP